MAFLSRNHDYAVVAIPSNSSMQLFDFLINIERRFQSAAGAPWHAPRERDQYFIRDAKPGDIRREPTTCLMLWSNPVLRLIRGFLYLLKKEDPFVTCESGKTIDFNDYIARIYQTADKVRPGEAKSQSFYAEAWGKRISHLCIYENCEASLRRFISELCNEVG